MPAYETTRALRNQARVMDLSALVEDIAILRGSATHRKTTFCVRLVAVYRAEILRRMDQGARKCA